MIKKQNKKASHVGMVLSFVIFVTFAIFLYTVIEPATRVERGKQDLLIYLETALIEDLSGDLTTSTINVKDSISERCIRFEVVPQTEEMNAVAKTGDTILNHKTESPNLITIDRGSADFLKVFYSDEFNYTGVTEPCLNPTTISQAAGDFELGLVRTNKYVFESRVQEMVTNFDRDYSAIKDKFNIAPGNEFGFEFEDSKGTKIGTEEKNISSNIYVQQLPIQYVDSEANIKSGFLRIRVW